jgi:hypothetical protein
MSLFGQETVILPLFQTTEKQNVLNCHFEDGGIIAYNMETYEQTYCSA